MNALSLSGEPDQKRNPGILTMGVLGDGEAGKLEEHIRAKAADLVAGTDTPRATFDDWLRFQFGDPLSRNAKAGPQYSKAFNALSVLTIAAGLASSLVAGVGGGSTVAIGILGIAVGIFTAANRIWNPARRSVVRYQAAYALRREGWDFVNGLGRYKKRDPESYLETFMSEIDQIHRGVESIDEMAGVASGEG